MNTSTKPPAILAVGGSWDITRLPSVRSLVMHLGYPSYFLVLLGVWKVLGAAALLVPRRALLKEWAYAGAFFTYTGAIVSHLSTGYDLGEVRLAATMAALTVLSWALRPASRRIPRSGPGVPLAVAGRGTPGADRAIPVPGRAAADAGEVGTAAATRTGQ